jgi:hypothetical protein
MKQIQITGCQDSKLWYATKMGDVLDVVYFEKGHNNAIIAAWCREDPPYRALNFVRLEDFVVIGDE